MDYFNENMQIIKREYFNGEYINKTVFFDTRTAKINQVCYTAPDGFCYLTEWYHFQTGASQGVVLFERNEKEAAFLKTSIHFIHIGLKNCVKKKQTLLSSVMESGVLQK